MVEIYPNLFIGTEDDYNSLSFSLGEWYIIHACKGKRLIFRHGN